MAALSAWFWNERFWLPHNVTWADLADPAPGVEYPKASHLLSALPLALGIFAVRILFERFIASPCAFLLHIHAASVHWRATPNPILEKVFTSITKCPDWRHLDGLSKQLDWDVRKVQRWFRQRRNQDKPSILTKFCESMWRSTFYLCIFTYGIRFLWQCPWMWDTHHCWYNYPYQVLTPGLYHYYLTELGFYWSLMFSQFTDIKRKDFPIMFIHHLATVSLISFSYANNMLRVGSLVMCVHDASDFILEAAKLANYAKYQRLCDFLFVLFAVVFFITRLVIYPLWILNTTMFESWEIIGPYPSWWLFNSLLLLLQVLHVIWSYLIAGIAYKALVRGKVSKDDRSDVESSSEEEADTNRTNDRGVKMAFSPKAENGTNGTNGHVVTTKSWPQIRISSRTNNDR
ncbi:ceramide synthase 5-like isoform X3 [Salvelinus fontinalis]|uniref:ceramide synthase 5-like isoform X3 n=1 Tax=Salvelinus fontinalis TaxID=8038 RepID=UPI0024861121|nr:ceramide synthase 5-like isoform X3 [Salvelinus fontinalis]